MRFVFFAVLAARDVGRQVDWPRGGTAASIMETLTATKDRV